MAALHSGLPHTALRRTGVERQLRMLPVSTISLHNQELHSGSLLVVTACLHRNLHRKQPSRLRLHQISGS